MECATKEIPKRLKALLQFFVKYGVGLMQI
jgi:hypothetical protein